MVKKLFRYFGGKFYLMDDILNIIEPFLYDRKFSCFVDVFGGSGVVLLNIPLKYPINRVYNDIDEVLVKVIKSIIDDNEREKLLRQLGYAAQSRTFFNEIKNKPYNEWTPFEYLYMVGITFNGGLSSYSVSIKDHREAGLNAIKKNIGEYFNILKHWNVENLDFINVIKKYDSTKTFFYLDPPYLIGGKTYKHGFSMYDSEDLKNILGGIKGYWLMNESEIDFIEIKKLFGEPKLVKYYKNNFNVKSENVVKLSERAEGYWANFEIGEVKK